VYVYSTDYLESKLKTFAIFLFSGIPLGKLFCAVSNNIELSKIFCFMEYFLEKTSQNIKILIFIIPGYSAGKFSAFI